MKKPLNIKKLVLLNLPYILMGLFSTNFGEAWRMAQGADASEKVLSLISVLPAALGSFWPSFHPLDLLVGLCCGAALRLAVYLKGKNAKKYRPNIEYGSARWGNSQDIAPYVDPVFQNNVILTQTERLTMSSRPKDPKTARNKNVLVIGGSGSGKTRFWLKPNLMQLHSSYVVTDPKGTILIECGKLLQRGAPKLDKDGKPMKDKNGKTIYEPYRIKVLNTINFKKSMKYNPFAYIHSEKDILKLVTTLIANTKGEGKAGDDFWVKAETLLYCALIGYIHYEAPVEEQNFSTLIEFINAMEVREDDEEYKADCGLFSVDHYAYSIKVAGDAYTESCAYQDVPINKAGKTFVLSGWAKADAIPDNVTKATGDDAEAKDKHKQFGLRAVVTYTDNTTEYHYVPFNPDVKDWQYVSTAVVPKKDTTVVKTTRVICAYERNGNVAYFDNLSLTEEAAQTMKYDKDSNLVSVKSSGSSEEKSAYSGGNLKSLKTGGDGTFTYTYDDNHNLKTATNGIVTETMTYDSSGNALTATISPKSGTDKIVTTNTYTNSGNQLSTVKQRGAFTTTYNYAGNANKMYGLASSVVDPMGLTVSTSYDAAGRPTSSSVSQSGATKGSVAYQYTQGMLNTLTRTASGGTQTYNFAYDSFGNMTKLQVGSRTLAEYTYGSKNGQLNQQTYGNGDSTSFQYDHLNRTTKTTTSSGDSYTYSYTGDGQLHKMEDVAAGVTYRYNYDAIGRLIGTSQTGGAVDLRAAYG